MESGTRPETRVPVLVRESKAFFCCPLNVDGLASYELDPQFESALAGAQFGTYQSVHRMQCYGIKIRFLSGCSAGVDRVVRDAVVLNRELEWVNRGQRLFDNLIQ